MERRFNICSLEKDPVFNICWQSFLLDGWLTGWLAGAGDSLIASRSVQYSPSLGWLSSSRRSRKQLKGMDRGRERRRRRKPFLLRPALTNRLTSKPSHTPRVIKCIIPGNLDKLYSTMKHPSRVYPLKFYLVYI